LSSLLRKEIPPKVSINLCCYNGEEYLDETLQSISSQTFKDWELVVINDGSTDGSEEIIKKYALLGWPVVYHYQTNKGLGISRNKALVLSSGSYIAFIDQDDIWMPKKLEKQIKLFNKSQVGLVFSDVIFFNNQGQKKRLYKSKQYWTGYCFPYLLSQYYLSLPTVVIRRSALDLMDEYFDPRFNMIEEADLFRRIGYSWKLAMVNESLAKWRIHSSSGTYAKYNKVAEETSLMLEKYGNIYPDFNEKYRKEIVMLKKQVSIDAALSYIRNGDKLKARKMIGNFKSSGWKSLLIYFITYLPLFLITFMYKIKSRLVISSPVKP